MIAALSNHLWQSTIFGLACGLLAVVLRHNQARVRYWVWLAASIKFVVPFSALVALGRYFGPHRIYVQAPISFTVAQFAAPYASMRHAPMASPAAPSLLPVFVAVFWFCGASAVLLLWGLRWRRIAWILQGAERLTHGREVEALRRLGERIPVVCSSAPLEPGIFGIWRPVLFWPRGISQRLSEAQLESILAHEASHVRRRDNLAAAMHMLVEAVFWFHPLVWWIGARLVEEREHACDEAAVGSRGEPRAYAEGILKVCEYCIEAPLACVSGVSGADLKRRVQAIMSQRGTRDLTRGRRLLLTASALVAIALPLAIGVWTAPPSLAQPAPSGATPLPHFEVASIKPAAPDQRGMMIRPGPNGGININNLPLKEMITLAWKIQPFQVSGGPAWIESQRWDITATGNHKFNPEEMPVLVQSLLEDRFQLKIHHETKELSVYALVLANKDGKLGPQLTPSKEGSCTPFDPSKPPPPPPTGRDVGKPPAMGCGGMFIGPDRLGGKGITIDGMTPMLARMLGRTVIDKTGLTGKYDVQMQWTPDQAQLQLMAPPGGIPPNMPQPQFDPNGPTLFTALQEQLGLKLESQKGPVDILVIDSVEKPSDN